MTPNIILYVEDEPQIVYNVRIDLKRSFPNHRFEVHERVPDALRATSESIDEIVVVIADGSIADSTGWELAQNLRDRGYDGPILYTGFTDLPEKYQHFFCGTIPKSGFELISKLKEYLE